MICLFTYGTRTRQSFYVLKVSEVQNLVFVQNTCLDHLTLRYCKYEHKYLWDWSYDDFQSQIRINRGFTWPISSKIFYSAWFRSVSVNRLLISTSDYKIWLVFVRYPKINCSFFISQNSQLWNLWMKFLLFLILQIRLVNISSNDIVDGNPKLTLGLLWAIILHWQVRFFV